jgi:hypothetical protein
VEKRPGEEVEAGSREEGEGIRALAGAAAWALKMDEAAGSGFAFREPDRPIFE